MPLETIKLLQLGLAPMEGVTELATRLFFALTSPPKWMSTPFLRVTPNFPASCIDQEFSPELDAMRTAVPYRLVPQVMAASTDDFIRISEHFLKKNDFIEINCGCPSPTVVGGGAGSALLKDADRFIRFISKIASAVGPRRLAVKMRTGFGDVASFEAMIGGLADIPLARLSIHGRTRVDRYQNQARWDLIQHAAQALPFGLWGSGDICDQPGLVRRTIDGSLEGVLIGRGALRNPWFFQELKGGLPVSINFPVLELALATFLVLQTAYLRKDGSLLRLADTGLFLRSAGTDVPAWEEVFGRVCESVLGQTYSLQDLDVDPKAFARGKMMWHYLRSGLPVHMNSGLPLRSTKWAEFLDGVQRLGNLREGPDRLTLRLDYKEDLDWLYAGRP